MQFKNNCYDKKKFYQNILFFLQIIGVFLLSLSILVTANLLVAVCFRANLEQHSDSWQQIIGTSMWYFAQQGHHWIIYGCGTIIFCTIVLLQIILAYWLNQKSLCVHRLLKKLLFILLVHTACTIANIYWLVRFAISSINQQDHSLFILILILLVINVIALFLICGYAYVMHALVDEHYYYSDNVLSTKSIIDANHQTATLHTFESFFDTVLFQQYSYKQRIFYLKEKKRHVMFGLDNIAKLIFKICCPQVFMGFLYFSYIFVQRYVVNHFYHHINHNIRGSVNIALSYSAIIYNIGYLIHIFIMVPSEMMFSNAFARHDRRECEKIISFSLFLSFLIVPIAVALFYISIPALSHFQGNGLGGENQLLTQKIAILLMKFTIIVFVCEFIFYFLSDFVICEGRSYLFLLTGVSQFFSQILLIWLLVKYVDWGAINSIILVPLGEIISFLPVIIVLLIAIICDRASFIRVRWKWIRPYSKIMIDYFKTGFAILIRTLAVFFILWINLSLVVKFQPLFSHEYFVQLMQYISTVSLLFILIRVFLISILISARQLLSYCFGAQLHYRLKKIFWSFFWIGLVWCTFFTLNSWWIVRPLLHFLNPNFSLLFQDASIDVTLVSSGMIIIYLLWLCTDLLQIIGLKNYVTGIYVLIFLLGTCTGPYLLWLCTQTIWPWTRNIHLFFSYNIFQGLIILIIIGYTWFKSSFVKSWWRGIKPTSDSRYNRYLIKFSDLMQKNSDQNIHLSAKQLK